MIINPIVRDEKGASDIFAMNLEQGVVYLTGPVTAELSTSLIAQLLYLDATYGGGMKNGGPDHVDLYINSPGGSVSAGLAIYDTMQTINLPVYTWCTGSAASMAAVILSGGEKGHRYMLPHSEVMIHQPSGGVEGQSSDMLIAADHIRETRKVLNEILSENTGQDLSIIEKDTDRDHWMKADDALAYGIVDKVVRKTA